MKAVSHKFVEKREETTDLVYLEDIETFMLLRGYSENNDENFIILYEVDKKDKGVWKCLNCCHLVVAKDPSIENLYSILKNQYDLEIVEVLEIY